MHLLHLGSRQQVASVERVVFAFVSNLFLKKKKKDNSFSLFGGGGGAPGEEQPSFSSLFQPAGGDAGKWGAFPSESPIVARTHSVIPDLKTPGFLADGGSKRESLEMGLNDSYQGKSKASRNAPQIAPAAVEGEGEPAEDATAQRNEMFFTIAASGKPVVERKFVLASDRRAAARRKNQPKQQMQPKVATVVPPRKLFV